MKNAGKWAGEIFLTAIMAAIALSLIGYFYGLVTGLSASWGQILGIILAVVLFAVGARFHKGNESFVNTFPTVLIVMAIMGALGLLLPNFPLSFVVEQSWVGLALGFSAVWLAGGLTAKFMH